MMHTKSEILNEITRLEQEMNRVCVAEANRLEARRNDLLEIVESMRADQLADVELDGD